MVDLLEAIDEVDEEKILQQPNLVEKMNLLGEKGLIDIDEDKIKLTAQGRKAKDTGQFEIKQTKSHENYPAEKQIKFGKPLAPLKKIFFRRKR